MSTKERPLSPHLQVYRLPFPALLSISHRFTGLGLVAGTLLLVYWLLAAAAGPESYATAQDLIGSWLGRLLLFGWTFALFYHLLNGIRHLIWDMGWGFEIRAVYISGWMMLVAAGGLTLLSWVLGYLVAAGGAP